MPGIGKCVHNRISKLEKIQYLQRSPVIFKPSVVEPLRNLQIFNNFSFARYLTFIILKDHPRIYLKNVTWQQLLNHGTIDDQISLSRKGL